ncbi:MAG: FtsX-like permease family protein [Bacteroidota bacterium]
MKHALRYVWRNKISTCINVCGLTVALSSAFLMLQYLDFELSYDTFLPDHKQVYRVATRTSERSVVGTYYGFGDWVTETFPEVEASTRCYRWPANTGLVIEVDGNIFHEKSYLYADKNFFNVFPSLLIAGNAKTALAEPNTVVISERLAMKVFGTTDIIGKSIVNPERKNSFEKITGIIRNIPANSHLEADIIRPSDWIPEDEYTWKATVWTYIRVASDNNIMDLTAKLNNSINSKLSEPATLSLQSLSSIHLTSNLEEEAKAPGSLLYIYVVGGALALVLLVAWINYVNLETARFIKRLKEVGIRRIIGSRKRDLLARFLMEVLIVTTTASLLATIIVIAIFPWFGYVTGLSLSTFSFSVTSLWITTGTVIVVATIIAGVYPMISLVRINPISSLKGHVTTRKSFAPGFVRRPAGFLLTFQFVTSLTLMALVVMASLQLDFMRSANTNFDTSGILTVYNSANYTWREDSLRQESNEAFRNQLLQIPSVTQLTISSAIPGEPIGFTYTDLAKRSRSDADRQVHYKVMYIDYDFFPLFGLKIVAGRNYSPEYSDDWCIVVTESTVRELGFSSAEEAVNQKIWFNEPDDWHQWNIIGVVKDYRHQSIKTAPNPGIFRLHRNKGQMVYYSMKLTDANAIPAIERLWKETWPGKPFDYFFMDQHYDQQYKSEIHFSRIFFLFSGVAVFIACLGVMGMSLFEANARIKEIGIRKVLGAEVKNIIMLLTKGSVRVLILSLVVAIPLVYLIAGKWLATYPEHIELSPWFVAVPFVALLVLVIATSTSQILKTALRNPVESLKHE